MASILDRYGIKEVADVTFYRIDKDGKPAEPVLFLDTLKVSTIEQTAESVDARGGKGNPKLITWDYGKEITVNIEDALFSPKSMSIMLGDGSVAMSAAAEMLDRTAVLRLDDSGKLPEYFIGDVLTDNGAVRKKIWIASSTANMPADAIPLASAKNISVESAAIYAESGGSALASGSAAINSTFADHKGEKVFLRYQIAAIKKVINVSADTFPGTYYVTGDTYSRSDIDGSDQFFQFVIPKAKMSSENTITLEAEGDPSTFNMNLTVLRPEDGDMMKLIQYDLAEVPSA